jgi:hypothetical protein
MALSPGFRADFRESLYRMIFALTGIGVTILSTVEVDESFTEFPFSTYSISFLTDDIIRLRYVSIDGQLRKIMVVIKMRGGNHAKDIREYEITSKGVVILGKRLIEYQGLISGIPVHSDRPDSTARIKALVSDPSFSIAIERKPLVNKKHPTEETQRFHRGGPSSIMRLGQRFIFA